MAVTPIISVVPKKSCIKKHQAVRKRQRNDRSLASVKFGQLDIVELAYILGDHPGCTSGVPLAMGNERIVASSSQDNDNDEAQSSITMDIDYFEQYRPRRRTKQELLMSKQRRCIILLNSGYTKDEIRTAMANVKKVKQQRMATVNQVYYEELFHNTKARHLSRTTTDSNKSVALDDTESTSSSASSHRSRILLPVQTA